MQLNKKHFEYFKKRVEYWQKRFELMNWKIEVIQEKKSKEFLDAYLEHTYQNEEAKIILLTEGNRFSKKNTKKDLDDTAKHEVIHLILSKYEMSSKRRYIQEKELDEELEIIVRKLTRLL